MWPNEQLQYAVGAIRAVPTIASGANPRRPTPLALDLDGVRAVVLSAAALRGGTIPGAPQLASDPVAYNGPAGVVLANPSALPQAFVAYRWRQSSGLDESLTMLRSSDADADRDQPLSFGVWRATSGRESDGRDRARHERGDLAPTTPGWRR